MAESDRYLNSPVNGDIDGELSIINLSTHTWWTSHDHKWKKRERIYDVAHAHEEDDADGDDDRYARPSSCASSL